MNYCLKQIKTILQNASLLEDLQHDPSLLAQYSGEQIIEITEEQTAAIMQCRIMSNFFTASSPHVLETVSTDNTRVQRSTPSRVCEPSTKYERLRLAIGIGGDILQIVQVRTHYL